MNTEALRQALILARGDMIEAAASLHCRAWDVAEGVRAVPELQALCAAIREEKAKNASWDALTTEAFGAAVTAKLAVYRAEALEEIRTIAVMDAGDNAEMHKVKLAAAVKLFGEAAPQRQDGSIAEIMQDLAKRYQEAAPRLARLRVQLDFEQSASSAESAPLHLPPDTGPTSLSSESYLPARQDRPDDNALLPSGPPRRSRKSKSVGA